MGRTNTWTAEQDAMLRQLRAKGLPYSQIAKRMPGYTKNAIIGRAQRIGLSSASRAAESTRAQQNIKPHAERQSPVRQGMIRFGGGSLPKSVIPEKPIAPERPTANPVTLEDRRADQCGWPVNDGGPYLYCGAARAGHRRYCERHAGVGVGRGRAAAA